MNPDPLKVLGQPTVAYTFDSQNLKNTSDLSSNFKIDTKEGLCMSKRKKI